MATTRTTAFYNQYDFRRYMTEGDFRLIVDNANAKYNNAAWRSLGSWDTPSDSKVWNQASRTVPIMARASYLSAHAPKPMRNPSGWKFYTGNTPKFGHGYTFDEDDMFQLRDARNNTGRTLQDLIYESILVNSQMILGGIHNQLSHMCYELASTGGIAEQSVDGVSYEFKFDFEQNQYIEVSPAWFTEDSSGDITAQETSGGKTVNVIKDILDAQRNLTVSQNRDVNAWMINTDTLDLILEHPSVLKAYLANRDIQAANQASYVATRTELLNFMHDKGVWPFMVVDFKSVHEEDGIPVADAPAFDPRFMVAFNVNERMFSIKNTNSIWKDRQQYGGIARNTIYSFVEGRIAALSTWQENPIHNTVEFELYAGPVFRNTRNWARVQIFKHYGE